MNKHDWYFKQQVTEGDLDEAFDEVEDAIRLAMTDSQLVGISAGGDLVPAEPENLTVIMETPCVANDDQGRRIYIASLDPIDVSVDSNLVSTAVVTPGNSKIVSVFIEFDVTLSNPQIDGNSQEVFYDISESFNVILVQSAEAVNPTPPALQSGWLLCGDVRRTYEQTQILEGDISLLRQQVVFKLASSNLTIDAGTLPGAANAILQILDDHIVNVGQAHPASAIEYTDGSGGWADDSDLEATNVQDAIDEIVDDLADLDGASRIGFDPSSSEHVGTDVHAALVESGVLAGANVWTSTNQFDGAVTHNGVTTFAKPVVAYTHAPTAGWQDNFRPTSRTFTRSGVLGIGGGNIDTPITTAASSTTLLTVPADCVVGFEIDIVVAMGNAPDSDPTSGNIDQRYAAKLWGVGLRAAGSFSAVTVAGALVEAKAGVNLTAIVPTLEVVANEVNVRIAIDLAFENHPYRIGINAQARVISVVA